MKFVFLFKISLLSNIFYCFCMLVNKHFIYLECVQTRNQEFFRAGEFSWN